MTSGKFYELMTTINTMRAYGQSMSEEANRMEVEAYIEARKTLGEDSKNWPTPTSKLYDKLVAKELKDSLASEKGGN